MLKKESKIMKYIGFVTTGTMFSRILGYARDMLVAWFFGGGLFADAFYAALRIPNLFRRLLGEGALSASFVPVFSEYIATKDKEETQKLFSVVFTALIIALLIMTSAGIILAPQITELFTWGFKKDPGKLELTVSLTRLMFPFLFFICLAAFLFSVLNSLKHFFIPAVSPALLSISEIGFILGIAPLLITENQVKGLAAAVVAGGLLQFLVQIPSIRKSGFSFRPIFNFKHPGLKQIFFLMIPAMWGISIDQVNAFVDTICASFLAQGSVTALYYSNRLMQLPLALFGIAVASVSLPLMSASVSRKDVQEMKNTLSFTIKISSLAILPAMAGLIILGRPMIKLLFEHGEFDSVATSLTTSALFFYSFGLLAFSYVKIFAGGFYSMKETKIPVNIATACMILNIILNIYLMEPLGVGGLAFATAISSWVNASLLYVYLRKRIGSFGGREIVITLAKISLATLVMSAVCYVLSAFLFKHPMLNVFGTIIIGIFIYFIVIKIFKIKEVDSVLSIIKRESPSPNE